MGKCIIISCAVSLFFWGGGGVQNLRMLSLLNLLFVFLSYFD